MDKSASKEKPYLKVPEPSARPGAQPDFSSFKFPEAGAAPRPPMNVRCADTAELASSLVRVLNDEHEEVGDWAGGLDNESKLLGLKNMLKLRAFDARMVTAQRQGKTSFYMQALGEEAIACAFQKALRDGDMNFPTYRQQGLLISSGYPMLEMMNQIYSNAADPLKGRQMPIMYSSPEHGFFSVSGNLGTQVIQAVGWAMGAAIAGQHRVAVGWTGEGATAQSDFHAALVFASTYRPPVVLNVVNNQYAISTFQGVARGQSPTFAARAIGYGIAAMRVDGNDYCAVHAAASWAVDRAREGLGPTLIEYVTYRAGAHSTSDDPTAYRPKTEAASWPLGDPVERLKAHLIKIGAWSAERHAQALAEIESEIAAVQKQAEAVGTLRSGEHPPARAMFDDVYKTMPLHLIRQRQEAGF